MKQDKYFGNNKTEGLTVDGAQIPVALKIEVDEIQEGEEYKTAENTSAHKSEAHKKGSWKRLTVIVALIVAILAVSTGVFAIIYGTSHSWAIKVGDRTITKNQYAVFKSQYKKYETPNIQNDKALKAYVISGLKYIEATRAAKSTISVSEIKDYSYANYGTKSNEWTNFASNVELSKIAMVNFKGDGYYAKYVFPFCKGFVMDLTLEPGYGDEAKIKSDEEYAKNRAIVYMKTIQKDLSLATARRQVAEIISNEKLDYGFAGNQSKVFQITSDQRQYESPTSSADLSEQTLAELGKLNEESPLSPLYTETRAVSVLEKYASPTTPIAYYFYAKLRSAAMNFDFDEFTKNLEVKTNV